MNIMSLHYFIRNNFSGRVDVKSHSQGTETGGKFAKNWTENQQQEVLRQHESKCEISLFNQIMSACMKEVRKVQQVVP